MKVVSINDGKKTELGDHLAAIHEALEDYLDIETSGLVLAILSAEGEVIHVSTGLSDIEKIGLLDAAKIYGMFGE